jgi:hypothetical protein
MNHVNTFIFWKECQPKRLFHILLNKYSKFNSAPGCICSLHPKNIFLTVKKFQQKISHVHLDNLCAFVQFHEKKNNVFRAQCKKDKTCLTKSLTFSTKFCHFHAPQPTSRFSMEILCAYVACEHVQVNFCLEFFNISKYIKNTFQNKGSPRAKTFTKI